MISAGEEVVCQYYPTNLANFISKLSQWRSLQARRQVLGLHGYPDTAILSGMEGKIWRTLLWLAGDENYLVLLDNELSS